MLLRASGEHSGEAYAFEAIIGSADAEASQVAGAVVLFDLADAYFSDGGRLADARSAVQETLGPGALVDAAGVIAIFDAVVRIADATGIPLEDEKARISADLRSELGLDDFAAPD